MKRTRGVERLREIMRTLRGPEGCPWDRKQTVASLKPYIIEEAFEVVEAMDHGPDELEDELGDLLLQIIFVSQIAEEEGLFTLDSVAERIADKLVRRHPHVFGKTAVKDANEVVQNWNKIKKDKEAKKYLLDGIPTAMPATLLAQRYADRAASVGFDWGDWRDTLAKIAEETAEIKEVAETGDTEGTFHEMGDLLAAVVNLSRKLGVNAEDALRRCALRFRERFNKMEELDPTVTDGKHSLDDLEALWQQAKKELEKEKGEKETGRNKPAGL